MSLEPTLTITKKIPYDTRVQQNTGINKQPLKSRLRDLHDDMVIRIVKKHMDEKYQKKESVPPDSNLNDNLQH